MRGKTGRRNADFTGSDEDLNLNISPPPRNMPICKQASRGGKRELAVACTAVICTQFEVH